MYQAALEKSGHSFKLTYEPTPNSGEEARKESKKRKRSIIWFNPPFSKSVKTNVGKQFLQLMDKHFPPGNPLHKIFNRSKVKMSYKCTPNLARKISGHNSKILNLTEGDTESKKCDCRKGPCPVQGNCLQKGVVYQATIKRGGMEDTYIGLTATSFKARWRNHNSNFKTRNPKNATTLSKFIWNLQDQNIDYTLSWKIVSNAKPFNHVTGVCNLCIREKFFIIFKPEMSTLNDRSEIGGPCLHKQSVLLKKILVLVLTIQ